MKENDDIIRKIKSLDNLKQYVLKNFLIDLNLDDPSLFFDFLIRKFFGGELDNIYDNELFDNMDDNSRKNVLDTVHKYQDLCFYDNDINNWKESIDGAFVDDYDLITYQLLDNFDFLIRLYLSGGEEALSLLRNFSKSVYKDNDLSATEDIRRNFVNDEILFNIFRDMSNTDSLYDVFTKDEKNTLLEYAEGVLYYYDNDSIKIVDPFYLILELHYRINGESSDITDKNQFLSRLGKLKGFFLNDDCFNNNVMDLFYEYQDKFNDSLITNSNKIDRVDNKNELKNKWLLKNNRLLEEIDSPIMIASYR